VSKSPGTRLLIAAGAAAATADEVPPQIRSLIRNASEVLLIAPVLTSKLHLWTSDVDHARHEADERLGAILAPDSQVRSERGSEVPLTAFDDAVRAFQPDRILIALRAADHAAWQEERLVDRLKQRFDIPITVFELDRGGHLSEGAGAPADSVRGVERPMLHYGRAGTRHAGSLYRRAFRGALHPIRKIEAETHHLRQVERVGDLGQTPFIAILGIFLFLLPIVGLIVGLAFAAYYLIG
jgi:hypothetical protein